MYARNRTITKLELLQHKSNPKYAHELAVTRMSGRETVEQIRHVQLHKANETNVIAAVGEQAEQLLIRLDLRSGMERPDFVSDLLYAVLFPRTDAVLLPSETVHLG